MLILNKQDAIYSATKLIKYFKDFNRIDDYFRVRKIERIKNIPQALPGMGLDDDMFQSYDMHPQDMNFEIILPSNETFDTMLEMVASFSPDNAPGKMMKIIVKETNTNKQKTEKERKNKQQIEYLLSNCGLLSQVSTGK